MKFLGVVNYMRNFVPNMADLPSNLRELLERNVHFQLTRNHLENIEKKLGQNIRSAHFTSF